MVRNARNAGATITLARNWPEASTTPAPAPVSQPRRVRRALLIQDDRADAETFAHVFQCMQLETSWAQTGVDGLTAMRTTHYDLLFIDRELPDLPASTLIETLRARDRHTRFFIVCGAVSESVTREALHLGALGVVVKPLDASDVIAAIQSALGANGWSHHDSPKVNIAAAATPEPPIVPGAAPRSIAERWALHILNAIHADNDPKTIARWARLIGVSRSGLCECCRLIHVSPHDARDFVRLMRVVCRSGPAWQPETLLDLADARTLRKLLKRAGFAHHLEETPTPAEFLRTQRLISSSNPGLVALRALLRGPEDGSAAITMPM